MNGEQSGRLTVWATITGLALVALLVIQIAGGLPRSETLPMLLAAVVGFELFLCMQDLLRWVRQRG